MLGWLTVVFSCQLAGETLVAATGMPLPGPVAGMVMMLVILAVRGKVPEELSTVSGALLSNLSLLFVPAGTGIITHLVLIRNDLLPVGLALVASTLGAVAVTGLLMQAMTAHTDKAAATDE